MSEPDIEAVKEAIRVSVGAVERQGAKFVVLTIEDLAALLTHCAETEQRQQFAESEVKDLVECMETMEANAVATEQRLAAAVEALTPSGKLLWQKVCELDAAKKALRRVADSLASTHTFNTAADRDEAASALVAARALLPPADGGEHG